MTKNALTIAAVALAGIVAAPVADAGHSSLSITYRSGFSSCGCPTYTQRYFRGYDRYRRPLFHYARLPLRHGSSCRRHAVHHRAQNMRHYSPVYQRSSRSSRSSRGYGPRIALQRRNNRNIGNSRGHSRGRSCR